MEVLNSLKIEWFQTAIGGRKDASQLAESGAQIVSDRHWR